MSALGATKRHDVEIHRYPILIYALVPLVALVLQAWLPRILGRFVWFDLPLVVTVYFSLTRQSPIQGMFTGAGLGLFQDALTHRAIGVNGIAKTLAGFLASSVGLQIDTDNQTIRLLFTFALSWVCSGIYFVIYRVLLGLDLDWNWFTELFKALGNSAIALVFFPLLDRTRMIE